MASRTFIKNAHSRFITATIIGTLFWLVFFYAPPRAFSIVLFAILSTIVFFEWKNIFPVNSKAFWVTLPFYPILPFGLLIYLNEMDLYRVLVYFLFIIVFSFDSGAYITGSLIGITPAMKRISPGKTIEGIIGGYISAIVMFVWALWDRGDILHWPTIFIFTGITCIVAFFGDIFESFLKRQAGIKDSSSILPGHGGFLDRFDAVMMVSFFFFICKDLFVQLFKINP